MQVLTKVPNLNYLEEQVNDLNAVFWDMDGTLVNTEGLHAWALWDVLQEFETKTSFDQVDLEKSYYGETDSFVFKSLQSQGYLKGIDELKFLDRKNHYFMKRLEKTDSKQYFNHQIKALIERLNSNGVKLALVTSSERKVTDKIMERLELKDYFSLILTREDTYLNKPDPMPYTTALEKLNLEPKQVMIFEDSPAGLEAAKQSGIRYFQVKWYS